MGKDKLPLKERELYAESIINICNKVANDPYNNEDWLQADDPWQALATMFEISNAYKLKNPHFYVTHLHCHVDGSCNGLQHYSALSRDYNGAYEVNLIDREKPGDVYTKVLNIALEKLKNEQDEKYKEYAKTLLDKNIVNRKVVKQTVMTSVYGVTMIGAKDQIKKQLDEKKVFDVETLPKISLYLAKITIESIGDLFNEADEIKSWLTKCAFIIGKSGKAVKWVTPLGLPCIQPYKKLSNMELVRTHSQGVLVTKDFDQQPVNAKKQSTAFPPNFIHSLDSTHMMMTCNRAINEGIVFSSVHDSYWSHPSDIDRVGQILREEFVNLYSKPLLQDLLNSFEMMYPELKFPELPKTGTLDLKSVLSSTYFFS
jgi:DNA-directed RNA polymerase